MKRLFLASKSSGFIVCEIKKGSLAYRAGSLIPGDRILAINSIPLDECSIEYAIHIFNQSTNIVTLKVQRNDSNRGYLIISFKFYSQINNSPFLNFYNSIFIHKFYNRFQELQQKNYLYS